MHDRDAKLPVSEALRNLLDELLKAWRIPQLVDRVNSWLTRQ